MKAPDLKSIFSEPVRNGIITGFSGMSAAAALQLTSSIYSGQSVLPGVSGLVMAFMLAGVSGFTAYLLFSRISRQDDAVLRMAEALSRGDFSKTILAEGKNASAMGLALSRIAERELDVETDRAKAAKDASLRHDQLADALDAIPQEITVYNRDGLLVSANRAYLSKCNEMGAVVALGMTWHDVMSSIAKAPGANIPLNERNTWINQQEAFRHEALNASTPVRFNRCAGKMAELLVIETKEGNRTEILRDISELVEIEERALRAQREAAAAESIKQVTLSRLSHTIRTPMTGVLAATELLADTDLDQRQRDRLDIIRRSASTLLGVVQDMFDLAAGSAPADKLAILQPSLPQKSALVLENPKQPMDETVASLNADGYQVGRAESVELLSEAIKVLAGQNRLPQVIHVPDFASRDLLFARLGGVENTGGLKVEVLSAIRDAAVRDNGKSSNGTVVDVIIAESDEVSRIAYANALASSNIAYRIVATGEDAAAFSKSHGPKLILLDMTLPDMDGLQTAAAIRKASGNKSSLGKVVAMTSHFVNGDMAKCLANGLDGYVLKPTIGTEMVKLATDLLAQEAMKKAG